MQTDSRALGKVNTGYVFNKFEQRVNRFRREFDYYSNLFRRARPALEKNYARAQRWLLFRAKIRLCLSTRIQKLVGKKRSARAFVHYPARFRRLRRCLHYECFFSRRHSFASLSASFIRARISTWQAYWPVNINKKIKVHRAREVMMNVGVAFVGSYALNQPSRMFITR